MHAWLALELRVCINDWMLSAEGVAATIHLKTPHAQATDVSQHAGLTLANNVLELLQQVSHVVLVLLCAIKPQLVRAADCLLFHPPAADQPVTYEALAKLVARVLWPGNSTAKSRAQSAAWHSLCKLLVE